MKVKLILILFVHLLQTAWALPTINTWMTAEGVKVMHVNAPELPMIDLALTFDAGSMRDGELPGLSVLTHVLLNKGTGDLNADDIAGKFEDVGAQFSTSVNIDRSSLSLRSLSSAERFESALDLFIDVTAKPSFPEKDFVREKGRMLVGLKESEQNPGHIVSREFYASLYQQHPYASNADGTVDSLQKISLEDIQTFHKEFFIANHAVLAIVGDIDKKRAMEVAELISGSLMQGEAKDKILKVENNKKDYKHIDFPSQQSHVRMGQIGIQRGHPDYFSLYVGNHILGGGGFTSRLVKEVRSNRGLSYSVYSYFVPYQQQGPFMVGLQTRSDQVAEAVDVVQQVLKDFVDEGPTAEELRLSKKGIMNGFPLRIDSNRDILGYLSVIGYYDLPLTYLNEFNDKVEQVTLEDIQQAFKRILDVDSMVTVVVGSEQETK